MSGRGFLIILATGCAALLAITPGTARAATIDVDTSADVFDTAGNCSLREAISSATGDTSVGGCTTGDGADEVAIPEGTYTLTIPRETEGGIELDNSEGDLDVRTFLTGTTTLRPQGPLDRVVIDGNGDEIDDRVLQAQAASGLTIEGLTIRGGDSGANGGGIRNDDSSFLTLRRVTVTGNASNIGGGIFTTGLDSDLDVVNSTISGNAATGNGGGIHVSNSPASLDSVTVAGNTADSDHDGIGDGGGISAFAVSPPSTSLDDTIIARNADLGEEAPDCTVTGAGHGLFSSGHTLVGSLLGCEEFDPGRTDITGVDPKLGPLAFNGGTNSTHALRPGSPAIDGGGSPCVPATDQRGVPRLRFGGPERRCDIGAYQLARCGRALVNRVGTPGADVLLGTGGRDGFLAFGGADRIRGFEGSDWICAGGGRDVAVGGAGNDWIAGQGGGDAIGGGPGRDLLLGGGGPDLILGGRGRDAIVAGRGSDRANGGRGRGDRVYGQRGRDLLAGGAGAADLCHGGLDADRAHRSCERIRAVP